MKIIKHIRWQPETVPHDELPLDGMRPARIELIMTESRSTFRAFLRLIDELTKTFPEATREDILLGTIGPEAVTYPGSIIISWSAYIPRGDYESSGWKQLECGRAMSWDSSFPAVAYPEGIPVASAIRGMFLLTHS